MMGKRGPLFLSQKKEGSQTFGSERRSGPSFQNRIGWGEKHLCFGKGKVKKLMDYFKNIFLINFLFRNFFYSLNMKYCFLKNKNSKQKSLCNTIGYNIVGFKSISLVTIEKDWFFNKYKKSSIIAKASFAFPTPPPRSEGSGWTAAQADASIEKNSFNSSSSAYFSVKSQNLFQSTKSALIPNTDGWSGLEHYKNQKADQGLEIGGLNLNLNKETQLVDRVINRKKKYTSYSKLSEVKLLTIGLASPLRILQWAEKTLPNGKIYGEVLNANTLHHKTFKPQKGGLFCERIFGPLKDFECACGKKDKSVKQALSPTEGRGEGGTGTVFNSSNSKQKNMKKVQQMRKFCPECDVEYTRSVIRRYQLGYIKLISPVTHIWFLKGSPSYLSLLLDIKKRHLQYITYCSETLTLENSLSSFSNINFGTPKGGLAFDSPSKIFESWQNIMAKTKKNESDLNKNKEIQSPTNNHKSSVYYDGPFEGQGQNRKKTRVFKKAVSIKNTHNKEWQFYQQQFLNKFNSFPPSPPALAKQPTYLIGRGSEARDGGQDSFAISDHKPLNINSLVLFSQQQQPQQQQQHLDNVNHKDVLLLNLLSLLNALNLSVYYQSMIVKNQNQSLPFNFELSNYMFLPKKQSFYLEQNKKRKKNTTPLPRDPISFKIISKKLPIDLFILSSIEQAIYKQTLSLAIKKAWYKIFKQGYIKAILKAYLISQNSNDPTLVKPTTLIKLDKQNAEKIKQLEKMDEIFRNIFTNEKKEISKQSVPRLALVLNMIKKIYQKHVLFALKKLKQPIFSTKKAILLNYSSQLIIDKLSDEISNYLMFKTNFIENKLTLAFLKPLLFVKYLFLIKMKNSEILNTLGYSTLTYGPTVSVENLSNNYGLNLSKNIDFVKKVKIEKEKTKKYPLSKELIGLPSNYKNSSLVRSLTLIASSNLQNSNIKTSSIPVSPALSPTYKISRGSDLKRNEEVSSERLFNNFYTLSHRERWDNEKDWQVFLLYNSAVAEYTDLPIPAYKNRLFSTSPFGNPFDNKKLVGGQRLPRGLFFKDDLILSNAFYSGPGIVKHLIDELTFAEIQKLDKQNRLLLYQLNKIIGKLKKQVQIFVYDKAKQRELKELCKRRDLLIRRTKLVRKLFRKDSNPSSMILTVLPVLPPDLRPIVKMGGQIAASDLNRLYQRVIYRNERLKKFLKDPATSHSYEMKYAQRLLQEAVDNLIQNGKSGVNSEKDSRGRILKSLSDNLKGKQGRFRQFLLGKRVDYSGRSVIVVGPKLKLHECGIPVEMAKELYLPFILKSILNKSYAKTVVGAKTLMKTNPALVHELLREIMQVTPVLLNRAPTLHRLGIQAFVPKLVEGRAILLHPLVCSAFNADFDGDQMAVHVPITVEARSEAWKLMLSRNSILSPATGDPLAIPSQDMVLGSYYLTTYSNPGTLRLLQGTGLIFNNFQDVMKAYRQQQIDNHALIWVKWNGIVENGTDQEEPIEIRISNNGNWQEISSNYHRLYEKKNLMVSQYIATTPGRIFWNLLVYDIIKH
jgi:DNA-directed RNA polymerase beta' subunit